MNESQFRHETYYKEDLVWEAVRRNKDYKKFYQECKARAAKAKVRAARAKAMAMEALKPRLRRSKLGARRKKPGLKKPGLRGLKKTGLRRLKKQGLRGLKLSLRRKHPGPGRIKIELRQVRPSLPRILKKKELRGVKPGLKRLKKPGLGWIEIQRHVVDVSNKIDSRWLIKPKNVLDPNIDIDTIKDKIKNGERPGKANPYYVFCRSHNLKIRGATKINVPKMEKIPLPPFEYGEEDTFPIERKIASFLNTIRFRDNIDHIICSINPFASDKDIINEIKKLKANKRNEIKKKFLDLKNQGHPTLIGRDIKKNIEYLIKYSEIIEDCYSSSSEKPNIVDGCVMIPDGEDLVNNIPIHSGVNEDNYSKVQQNYNNAYNKAV